jgi:ATP-dependent helicase/DNAse subunit B
LDIPELEFPVHIRGNVDRVDLADGILRIIDYKTGKVSQNQLEIVDWDHITSDYDRFSKPFQVLMYACMLMDGKKFDQNIEAGVISFKNLKEGFLKFTKKDKPGRGAIKKTEITEEVLEKFRYQLEKLILEICDPEIEFIEKEIKPAYGSY